MKTSIKTSFMIGFILALAIIPFAGFTQNSFDFGYDAAGNRISRTITLKSAEINDGIAASQIENPVEEKIGFKTTRIYPNPTKGVLHIEISSENNQESNLTVHDLHGKLITQNEGFLYNCDINLSSYPAGVYILRVFIGSDSKEWKVIKE
jgi:hypothetical protein